MRQRKEKLKEEKERQKSRGMSLTRAASSLMATTRSSTHFLELSLSRSRQAKVARSSASLLGAYGKQLIFESAQLADRVYSREYKTNTVNLEKDARRKRSQVGDVELAEKVSNVVDSMVKE